MAVNAFKFSSPGIFLNEVDQSQIPQAPAPVGPIIIGRAQRGPAMRPVTVSSFDEFVATFGEPVAGGDSSGDVWRSGIPAGPTYGGYAAQAWLANNPTVTYIRLLGVQSDTATSTTSNNAGYAGWSYGGAHANNGAWGSYGLFIFPSASLNVASSQLTGALAAVWYCSGSTPVLSGTVYGGTSGGNSATASNATFILGDSGNFTVQMFGSNQGAGIGVDAGLKKTFNFNPTSDKFIRKVFNTNPQSANTSTDTGLASNSTGFYGYWLGETFENDIFNNTFSGSVPDPTSSTGPMCGIIMPIDYLYNKNLGVSAKNDYAARTGWIISQVAQGQVPTYNPATTATKLFRFIALDAGGWARNNIKVTINNIQAPPNDAVKYGTFDVEIRMANDTDFNKKIVESFTGCDLDKNSPNYIARRIGDKYYDWDDNNRVLGEKGIYDNNSKYIRVEINEDVEDFGSLVPFGVLGPMKYVSTVASVSANATAGLPLVKASSCFMSGAGTVTSSQHTSINNFLFTYPSMRQRINTTDDSLTNYTLADWGASTTRTRSSILYNEGINDLLRLPLTSNGVPTAYINGTSSSDLTFAWTFSLDNVKVTGTVINGALTNPVYSYSTGSKADGTSFTATGSTDFGGTYAELLADGVNSFTTVLQGGTDGFNILEGEPLRNSAMSSATDNTSYIYYTYRRAIDTVKDPEFVQGNVLTIPGLSYEPLTDYELQIAEQRGDVLAIVDLSKTTNLSSYVTKYEKSDANFTADRVASVDAVVSNMKDRNINNSYGATYYPWVQISDSTTGKIIPIPPSIVALGAMSYTDSIQAPWFAPAGFNRGGLSTGNAGVNVVNVVKKLSQSDRDKLYPVNINPITSFPNEGIVIFGQKTLQATPSALDRINVRRLMIYIKRGINLISTSILFEPNVEATWNNFKDQAEPFLADVKARFGLTDYKLILDSTTTTPDLIDQNILYAKIFLKPARAIEFIAIDFFITRSGAEFPV